MKIVPIILLVIILPSLAMATSMNCANNYNKATKLYNEGQHLANAAIDDYEAFHDLQSETTSTFHRNHLFNRQQQENSTDKIKTAVNLLDAAIKKTKQAKSKYERSLYYAEKAEDYCYDSDYDGAVRVTNYANVELVTINKKLSGGTGEFAFLTPDYSVAKYELLASTIRITMSDAAIYLIENEEIDLNYISEGNRPLLIIAAENGSSEIASALINNGANIDVQNENGYSAIEIAAISGNLQLFTYLFEHKASSFQLSGFNKLPKYKTCNIADMVQLSSYSEELGKYLFGVTEGDAHTKILDFLKSKGLTPVCNLNPLLAMVNGKEIRQNDVDIIFKVKIEPEFHHQNPSQKIPASDKISFEKDILNHLISQYLQVQLAQTLGIEADKDKVDKYATEMHNRLNNVKNAQVRNYVKNEILSQNVTQHEVVDKISIQDRDLKAFYADNPDIFIQPESIRVSHILMTDKNKLAEVILMVKNDGSNFATLAREYSEGSASIKGGDLGFFQQGQMVKPFNDSVFALNTGEISDIVETKEGFHIIKLIERKPASVVPFAEIKARLYEHMKQQKAQQEVDKWLKSLRVNATIEVL